MDISLKYKIAEKIIESNDDTLLNQIKSLLGLSENDFWGELPIEVQQAIRQSEQEFELGCGIPHLQVMDEIKKRFSKV